MQAREAAAHFIQPFFAQRFFDAREHFVLFQPHVIVKKFPDAPNLFRLNLVLGRDPLLEIQDGGANLGVIAEKPHHVRILVNPRVPRVRGQKNFFLFAKMNVPRFVPETHKFLRLPRDRGGAFLNGSFRRASHLQRLNQREMMVLAERMQTRVALHSGGFNISTAGSVQGKRSPVGARSGFYWTVTFTVVVMVMVPEVPVTVKEAAPVGVPGVVGALEVIAPQPLSRTASANIAKHEPDTTRNRAARPRIAAVAIAKSAASAAARPVLGSAGTPLRGA